MVRNLLWDFKFHLMSFIEWTKAYISLKMIQIQVIDLWTN